MDKGVRQGMNKGVTDQSIRSFLIREGFFIAVPPKILESGT